METRGKVQVSAPNSGLRKEMLLFSLLLSSSPVVLTLRFLLMLSAEKRGRGKLSEGGRMDWDTSPATGNSQECGESSLP